VLNFLENLVQQNKERIGSLGQIEPLNLEKSGSKAQKSFNIHHRRNII
jgi:hypothetical protein